MTSKIGAGTNGRANDVAELDGSINNALCARKKGATFCKTVKAASDNATLARSSKSNVRGSSANMCDEPRARSFQVVFQSHCFRK